MKHQTLSSFIWSVADLLRGDYKQSEYGKVILPFSLLRRLECVLEPAEAAVLADLRIGHLMAHSPPSSKDQAWPHESVRILLENLASDEIERGVSIEGINMRGIFSKAIGEGGAQERGLAEQSNSWANAMPGSPKTAALLMRISESWMREVGQADISAEKEALRW